MDGCLACDLITGAVDLPGGRIYESGYWVVEHCVGPLPAGTLILKPFRHVTHVYELTEDEVAELGPMLQQVSQAVELATAADQVYICLWSHAGWQPGHIHFVLQPAWNSQNLRYSNPGPSVQVEMFEANEYPDTQEVIDMSSRVSTMLRNQESAN